MLAALPACGLDLRARCVDDACPDPARCDLESQTCVLPAELARQILIQSPPPAGVVQPKVLLVAMVLERVKLEDGLPPSLPFQITDASGTVRHQGSLLLGGENVYRAPDWEAPEDVTYELSVRGEVRGLFTTTSRFTVDRVAPTFTPTVPAPVRPPSTTRVAYADPNFTNIVPWRRDERVTLTVRSDEPHLDPESVAVAVTGVGAGSTEGRVESPLPVKAVSGCGSLYCGSVELDLSKPQLRDFRGTFKLRVTGRDLAGNEGSGVGAIAVTRWKWRQQPAVANSPTQGPLALDSIGAVARVVRAPNGSDELSITEPSGAVRWALSRGTFTGGPVMGRRRSGSQTLYLLDNKDAGTLLAYETPALTAERTLCSAAPVPPGNSTGALALADLQFGGELAPFESVVGVATSQQDGLNRLFAARTAGSQECIIRENVRPMVQGVTMKGSDAIYPSPVDPSNQLVVRNHFEAIGWLDVAGFPVGMVRSGLLAILGNRIFGGGGPRIFSIPGSGGALGWRYPNQDSPTPLQDVVISADSTLFFKGEGRLFELQLDASTPIASSPVLTGTASGSVPPTLGKGGLIYVPSQGGLDVLTRDLQRDWGYPDPEMVDSAPLLDCTRDEAGAPIPGRPGVAYLAGATGMLTAAIVDSAGMDTNAKWPRHRHDSRNTGNSETSLPEFSCP